MGAYGDFMGTSRGFHGKLVENRKAGGRPVGFLMSQYLFNSMNYITPYCHQIFITLPPNSRYTAVMERI
jgi:hypothetical protein